MPQFSNAQPVTDQQLDAANPGDNPQPVPFWNSVQDGADSFWNTQRVGGRRDALSKALRERNDEIAARTGVRLPSSWDMDNIEPWDLKVGPLSIDLGSVLSLGTDADRRTMGQQTGVSISDDQYEQRVEQLRQQQPDKMAGVMSRAQLNQFLTAQMGSKQEQATQDARTGFQGQAGTFTGGVVTSFADPVTLAPMVATDGGSAFFRGTALAADASRPLIGQVLASSARGAITNAAFQAAQTPFQVAEAEQIGPAYTWRQAAGDIGNAAIAGGVLGPVAEGLGEVLKWGGGKVTRALLREGVEDPVERGALQASDQFDRDELALRNLAPADFETARDALVNGAPKPDLGFDQDLTTLFDSPEAEPSTRVNRPQLGPDGASLLAEQDYRGRPIYAASFDPATLQADPQRFQYKADGDAQGVTERLRGVQQWDPTASGKTLVWEAPDGQRYIADGHQRLGLANRLRAAGFDDARLDGYLLRSADGWTAGDARIIAALKNIREGSGTPLDAAKVFREAPQALNDRSLPVTGEFISQARGLARLGEDAFRAVINKVIPERYGAILGDMAGERPDLQPSLLKLLVDGEPANIEEARALVSEGLLDDFIKTEGAQTDLFGGVAPELTTIARAKVKASVLRSLKSNAELMASLVRRADAIEAGGNVLARDANEASLGIDRAALELVDKLSMRDGPIGQAMADAARAVAEGKRPVDAARPITEKIRQAIRDGHALDLMRGEEIAPAAPSEQSLQELKAFDDPDGAGAKEQAQAKPEDRALEVGREEPAPEGEPKEALHPGLFDDLPAVGAEERARARLAQCAPE
jgi:hypothetical protein